MKKFFVTVYLFALSLLVFAMSGCGGSNGGDVKINTQTQNQNQTQTSQSKRMIITSPALKRGDSYRLYRGDKVGVAGTTAKYYAAPATNSTEKITMNLEYLNSVNDNLPFIITDSTGTNVIFSYNPNGTTEKDFTTPYGSVIRQGGEAQQLGYTNLNLSASSVELEESEGIIDIVLKSDGTATAAGTTVPSYDYVWHADPQHPAEYWTEGIDGTDELDEDAYADAITSKNNGLYIAHDIRYTSNTLDFSTSKTAKKDEDTEYVVYYDFTSSAVREGLAKNLEKYSLGSAYSSDQYIFATLPMSTGMGGAPGGTAPGNGGTPPDGGTPPNMQGGFSASDSTASNIASFSTMTHSAEDAYANPVLHITEPGTYRLSGTWKGQIWIELDKAKAGYSVGLILSGVTVTCDVAPALVFYKVYKWAEENGYDSQSVLTENDLWKNIGSKMLSDDYYVNGAIVEIADGTTNTFTGANLYRILELCPKLDDDDNPKYTGSGIGTDISEQEKMYKLDGAFHSRRTMVIGGGSKGTGTLNITSSTYEGLDSEMHMVIDGGVINVTAPDDAINVNEDYVSVFQMDSGTMTISSTNADGIDSNGWIAINGGTLDITAGNQEQNAAGEAGMDAENDIYISDNATYTYHQANTNGGGQTPNSGGDSSNTNTNTNTDTNTNTNTNTNTDTNTETNTNTNTNTDTNTETNTDTNTNTDTTTVTESVTEIGDSTFTLFPTSSTVETDTEGDRNIPSTGKTFPIVHRVNDFAGLTTN